MARSSPRPLHRAASFKSSASYVSATIEPNLRDTMPPWDTKPRWGVRAAVGCHEAVGMLCRCGMACCSKVPCHAASRAETVLSQSAKHFNVGAQDASTPCSYRLYPVCPCHSTQSNHAPRRRRAHSTKARVPAGVRAHADAGAAAGVFGLQLGLPQPRLRAFSPGGLVRPRLGMPAPQCALWHTPARGL
jgi:hypothetical protein